jgi:hypothetical protein
MDLKVPTVVSPYEWENLLSFISSPELLETLYNHLESIVPEWSRTFGDIYEEDDMDVISASRIVTGLLRVNKEEDSYTYGAVITVIIRDPNRYYTMMTRFVTVYMNSDLEAVSVSKSSIQPLMEDTTYQPGIVKK